ncbi:ABC transporter substrate-binding protein [Halobacterium sp. KA-4]|uniref:ABC transporter substrate-binding protein n=1 Tax=Halobacterium sp. KA-4 TaxID=2896367 RepID=UPI001E594CCE|nr:ABC transporter substrate-binding protein [Halobacterium sp. KA-4]MCD2201691.1 ABC transporter substrate-binding protein [Halobacterium sp. KA-4]
MKYSNRRKFVKTVGAGAGIGLVAGCLGGGGGGGGSTTSSGTIKIAALEPLTGPFSADAQRHLRGLRFAVERINQSGDLDRDLEVLSVDTKTSVQTATNAFSRLIEQENVVAATGPGASDVGIQTSRVAEEEGVPLLLFASGGVELTPETRYTYRVGLPPIYMDATAQAQWINELGASKVGAIVESAVWGQGFLNSLTNELGDSVEVVSREAPVTETTFTSYLRQMPKDVDVFTGSGHPVGLDNMYMQAYDLGFEPEAFPAAIEPASVSYDVIGEPLLYESFAPFYNVDFESDRYKSVASDYYETHSAFFDNPDACGFVSGKAIAEAITVAGSTNPEMVSQGLRDMKLETVFSFPLSYNEWCEMENVVQTYYGFEKGAPEYYPDGNFKLTPQFRSEPVQPDPDFTLS